MLNTPNVLHIIPPVHSATHDTYKLLQYSKHTLDVLIRSGRLSSKATIWIHTHNYVITKEKLCSCHTSPYAIVEFFSHPYAIPRNRESLYSRVSFFIRLHFISRRGASFLFMSPHFLTNINLTRRIVHINERKYTAKRKIVDS